MGGRGSAYGGGSASRGSASREGVGRPLPPGTRKAGGTHPTEMLSCSDCNGNPVRVQDLLLSTATVESSDCLIEGSAKDRVSHFTLR